MAERVLVPALQTDRALPPPCYGMEWTDLGVEVLDGRRLRCAEAVMSDRFHAAWGMDIHDARRAIEDMGFSWREAPGEPPHDMRVTYRSTGDVPTEAQMAGLEAWALDLIEIQRLRRAETEALRKGHDGEVRASLEAALRTSWWAMSAKDAVAADALLGQWRPDKGLMIAALNLVERAREGVRVTADKLRVEAAALGDADLCADPAVRTHVLAACRFMSAQDGDHATEANGAGWGKSTSRPGHWLAGQEMLDERRAALGLRLVRRHRRQLPEDLRAALGLAA